MDQFRGPMGSSAVAILLAYLASCPELRDSDEKRAEWCEMMLDDYRFIYASADGPAQRVSCIVYGLAGTNSFITIAMETTLSIRAHYTVFSILYLGHQEGAMAFGDVPQLGRP